MEPRVKQRLYTSAVTLVSALVFIGSILVGAYYSGVYEKLYDECFSATKSLDYCSGAIKKENVTPVWTLLLPYVPAGLLLWFRWLVGGVQPLETQSYPRKTISFLLWLGMVSAVAASVFSLWHFATMDLNAGGSHFHLPWSVAAFLAGPLLFDYALAPIGTVTPTLMARKVFYVLVATPAVTIVIEIARSMVR